MQGNTLYKEGQFLKAAAAYTQGLKADPTHSVLYRCRRPPAWLLGAGSEAGAGAAAPGVLVPLWAPRGTLNSPCL